VKFQQIIEDILSVTSAVEWKARALVRTQGSEQQSGSDEADVVLVRRLLRRAPRWKHGHQILRSIAERQGDGELVAMCEGALKRL